jgi:hypothetical protein
MCRLLTKSALVGLALFFATYLILPLFRHSEGEAGELYDCYLTSDKKSADLFFDKLDIALKAEQFERSGGPTENSIFISSAGAQTYWYQGSYKGSTPFTVAIMRDGPKLTCFHISYLWSRQGYLDVRPKMRQSISAMHAFLQDWSEGHGAQDRFTRD